MEPLAKSLELPLPPELTSEVTGIHQSDVIIRSAIIAAFADMRANPWLLDYTFASLAKDSLTMKDYGEKEIAQAKKWFLSTDVVVFMSANIVEPKFPCVTISLLESNEVEMTLADTHYVPQEDATSLQPALGEPFEILGYNAITGIIQIPATVSAGTVLAAGMSIVDSAGRPHVILEVVDAVTIKIAPGTVADFARTALLGQSPLNKVALESVGMKEAYVLGVHVQGEPVHLTYLHSALVFAMLRYKQALLEARGYERSTISSSDFRRNDAFDPEFVFSRHIQITGNVRQVWPKLVAPKLTGIAISPLVAAVGPNQNPANEPTLDNDEAWMDQDSLSPRR